MPSVVEALPVLDTGVGVYSADEPISMTIRSTKRRVCIVRVVCRGELVGVKTMEIGMGDTAVSVPIQDRAAGVIRVTVLDAEGMTATPLVELWCFQGSSNESLRSSTSSLVFAS